ncbi:MAG: ATP-binding protein [Acidimicrobiia bacterium]
MNAEEQGTERDRGIDPHGSTTRVARVVADKSAPGAARRLVRSWLGDHARADDAALALSEVVTNAVLHGGSDLPPLRVHFRQADNGFRVEVDQTTVRTVEARTGFPRPDHGRGRGLAVVEALAERWGVTNGTAPAAGTTVWFEM